MAALSGSLVRAALAAAILLLALALVVAVEGWSEAMVTVLVAGAAAAMAVLVVRLVAGHRPPLERGAAGGLAVAAASTYGGWEAGHATGSGAAALIGVALALGVIILARVDDGGPRHRSGSGQQ